MMALPPPPPLLLLLSAAAAATAPTPAPTPAAAAGVAVERLAALPAHGWMKSAFPFTYNPALILLPNGTLGLFARCEAGSVEKQHRSVISWSSCSPHGAVDETDWERCFSPIDNSTSVILRASSQDEGLGVQDPRVVFHDGVYFMT